MKTKSFSLMFLFHVSSEPLLGLGQSHKQPEKQKRQGNPRNVSWFWFIGLSPTFVNKEAESWTIN